MQLSKVVSKILKLENLILIVLLVLGFSVRLYRFNNPIADWHSWKQTDVSAVSRNFVATGFDVLHPRIDDISNVLSGKDNPNGYSFLSFPIYNVFQAGLFKTIGVLTLEEWGRMVTIVGSLFSALFLFLLVRKRFGRTAGLLTAFFFLFIPYSIYYSRVVLDDPLMVTFILGATYFFDKWLEKDKLSILNFHFLATLILTASAFLVKPYGLVFTLPMIYLAYEKFGFGALKKWQLWIFLIVSVIPLILWRVWMLPFPEGIPANAWLFNGGNIRFKGAFFYWIFADRIGRLISGYWGIALIILGILGNYTKKNFLFLLSFVVSSLIYVTVIAKGNVQHDYYQILIIPSLTILMGVGAASLLGKADGYRKFVNYIVLLVVVLFTIFFGWYYVRDYFNINNPSIIIAGAAVDKLTPKNAKVIANYEGDSTFLYQTKRKGWVSYERSLPELVKMGADYLVLANPTESDLNFGKTYKIIAHTSQYIIFNLRQKP